MNGDVSKGAACSKMATAKLGWVGEIVWAIAPNFGRSSNFLWFATLVYQPGELLIFKLTQPRCQRPPELPCIRNVSNSNIRDSSIAW